MNGAEVPADGMTGFQESGEGVDMVRGLRAGCSVALLRCNGLTSGTSRHASDPASNVHSTTLRSALARNGPDRTDCSPDRSSLMARSDPAAASMGGEMA